MGSRVSPFALDAAGAGYLIYPEAPLSNAIPGAVITPATHQTLQILSNSHSRGPKLRAQSKDLRKGTERGEIAGAGAGAEAELSGEELGGRSERRGGRGLVAPLELLEGSREVSHCLRVRAQPLCHPGLERDALLLQKHRSNPSG